MVCTNRRWASACLVGASAVMLVNVAMGQAQAPEEPGASLEHIVVTAQRRTENLQDVPISVTAVTAESLAKSGIASTSELLNVVPGLTMSRAVKGGVPFIRGVGSQDTSAGNETAVATYVDGVYYMDVTGIMFPFNNVKSIEVLKGPQGTLFGRNATGGLINVITRDPQSDPHFEGSLGYGNYSTVETSLYATGGSEIIAADLSVYAIRQDEGYGRNLLTAQDVNQRDEKAVRTKVVWTPTASDRLTFSADWASNKTDLGVSRNLLPGAYLIGGLTAEGTPYDVGRSAVNPSVPEAETWGGYLRYEHEFDSMTFSILTAVHKNHVRFRYDSDLQPAQILQLDSINNSLTYQTEALLVGKTGRFDWTAGVFLFDGYSDYRPLAVRGANPAANTDLYARGDLTSAAPFGQVTYSLTDATRITAGVRYTIDERRLSQERKAAPGNAAAVGTQLIARTGDVTYREPTWRTALDHKFSDELLGYVSYTRGFKSGVFNLPDTAQPPAGPETIDAFEVGLKSELFDHTLRLNGAVFHYLYDDIQLARAPNPGPGNPGGVGNQLLNAAEGRVDGLEIEATAVPRMSTGTLQLTAGLSVLDAKYESFVRGTATVPNAPAVGGNSSVTLDLSGNRMLRAPKWVANASADYSIPVAAGDLAFNVTYLHSDGYFWDADNRNVQDPYDLLNAQISYSFGSDNRYTMRAWGKNLTDEITYTYVLASSLGDLAAPAPPRTYGVTFDFEF